MRSAGKADLSWRFILAGALGGALVGALESARLGPLEGQDLTLPATAFVVGRLALAGTLLALPAICTVCWQGPRRTLLIWGSLLLMLLTAAGTLLFHGVSSHSPWPVTLFYLLAGAEGLSLLVAGSGKRRLPPQPWLQLGAGGLSLAAEFLDPAHLRGTYPPLDLFLLGTALGAAALAIRPFARLTWRPPLAPALVLVCLAAPWLWPLPGGAASNLLVASPRLAFLEGRLKSLGLGRGDEPSITPLKVELSALFAPPGGAFQARARWAAMRRGKPPLSVLWVTIDALRPEVTGLGGGKLTPHLDQAGRGGLSFTHAWAQGPATSISTGSMFHGRYPASRYPSHEALEAMRQAGEPLHDFPSLADLLHRAGWRTLFVSGMTANELKQQQFLTLSEGFSEKRLASPVTDAQQTAAQALALLRTKRKQPFFMWVHLFDPHAPYVRRPGVARDASPRARYEGEVRYADKALGQILRGLEENGQEARTVVVLNADHAEAFGEHGRYFHGTSYFDTQIRVPLVLRVPGLGAGVVPRPVENVAIMPTLLDLLKLPRPDSVQGLSLLPVLLDPKLPWPGAAFAETLVLGTRSHWALGRIRMATDGRFKLLDLLDDHLLLLFDLLNDPLEHSNLAARKPAELARLLGYLQALDVRLKRRPTTATANGSAAGIPAPVLAGLEDQDPAVRRATLAQLLTPPRHDLGRALERLLPHLRPDTAHELALLLQTLLRPHGLEPPQPIKLPRAAGPLRYRLLVRLAHEPGLKQAHIPVLLPPLAPLESRALLEIAAAHGQADSRETLKRLSGGGRAAWRELAPVLAMGGDPLGGALLLGELRAPHLGQDRIQRDLNTLLAGRQPGFAKAVAFLWPSPTPRLKRQSYARLVASSLLQKSPLAWLALHPSASSGDQRLLSKALRKTSPPLSEGQAESIAQAWAGLRYREGNPAAAAAGSKLLQLIPKGMGFLNPLQEEAQRALVLAREPLRGRGVEVMVQATGAAAKSPQRITLRCLGSRPVPLGPSALASLRFAWRGPQGFCPAGHLDLPRRLLAPSQSLGLPLPLDPPGKLGTWRLGVQVAAPFKVRLVATPSLVMPPRRSWSGSSLVRFLWTERLPLLAVARGAGLEVVAATGEVLHLPPGAAPKGAFKLSVDLQIHSEAAGPFPVRLRVKGQKTKLLGRARKGPPALLEGVFQNPTGRAEDLTLLFPGPQALVTLFRVTVTPH